MTDTTLTFFHSPNTRSFGTLVLLDELGAPHTMRVLDMKKNEQRSPDYLAINPMGKVPAILHNGGLVTEQAAVFIYLSDAFPDTGLAPAIGDPLRGPYLRWMAFYGSSFEPAIVDHAMKRPPVPLSTSPYGDFDTMFKTLDDQLATGPHILGKRFTAAAVLWGTALTWTTGFGICPKTPAIEAYLERWNARPSVARAKAKDAALVADQAA